ncbi:hypothetical protein FRB98_002874 [Tulasnella sp. 332]|nr:hypothetical protein FRB98_002874 [Tulasnella sp. 332]
MSPPAAAPRRTPIPSISKAKLAAAASKLASPGKAIARACRYRGRAYKKIKTDQTSARSELSIVTAATSGTYLLFAGVSRSVRGIFVKPRTRVTYANPFEDYEADYEDAENDEYDTFEQDVRVYYQS